MVGSQHPQAVGEQVAVLGGGLGGLPGLAQQVGEVAAGGEGVGVVGSQHPQEVGEQVAELGGGLGGLPGLAQPPGQVGAGGEGVGVVGSQHPQVVGEQVAELGLPANHDVTITTDGTRAVITAVQVIYTLPLLPPEEFPLLPEPGEPLATFGADHLATAVIQAVVAASRDDTLPALCCVHLTLDGKGTATLAATDRYRLAAVTCPYTPCGAAPPGSVLIPARDLAAAVKRPETATVTLALSGGIAALTADARQVTVRTVAAEFPDALRFIPAGDEIKAAVTADTAILAAAVKRAAVVAQRDTPVRLTPAPGAMHIEARTGDEAAYADDIPATLDGDPFSIAFKPAFLLDALATVAATGADTARLALTGPARPALITPAESPPGPVACRHVLMPVKTAG